jgi:hypothetical protein
LRIDHRTLTEEVLASHAKEVEHERALVMAARDDLEKEREKRRELQDGYDALVIETAKPLADASDVFLASIGASAVVQMQGDREKAFRIRDRAMCAIWVIDERHHAVQGEKCFCGEMLRKCKEYRALDYIRDEYQRWERDQIRRMWENQTHGLPKNHPEVRKANRPEWMWRGMPSTEPEPERRRVS